VLIFSRQEEIDLKKIILNILGVFCIIVGILAFILNYKELQNFSDIIISIISCITLIGCGISFICLSNF